MPLKRHNTHNFKTLEIEMLALKRQLTTLTITMQQKHQEKVESSFATAGAQDLALVHMGEVQTCAIRLELPVFFRKLPLDGYKRYNNFSHSTTFYPTIGSGWPPPIWKGKALVWFQDIEESSQFID